MEHIHAILVILSKPVNIYVLGLTGIGLHFLIVLVIEIKFLSFYLQIF